MFISLICMSSRTSPQTGVAIPWTLGNPNEIATPVCALARNDVLSLNFHAYIPGTPDDGAQVAYLVGIAHDVDILGLFGQRRGLVAGGQDHGIRVDLEFHTIGIHYGDTIVMNRLQLGFQMDGNLVGIKEIPEVAVLARHTPLVVIRSSCISTMVGFLPWRYSS